MRLSLYVMPNTEESKLAFEILQKILPADDQMEVIACTESMAKIYHVPFVRFIDMPYFGLPAIRSFADNYTSIKQQYSSQLNH